MNDQDRIERCSDSVGDFIIVEVCGFRMEWFGGLSIYISLCDALDAREHAGHLVKI